MRDRALGRWYRGQTSSLRPLSQRGDGWFWQAFAAVKLPRRPGSLLAQHEFLLEAVRAAVAAFAVQRQACSSMKALSLLKVSFLPG